MSQIGVGGKNPKLPKFCLTKITFSTKNHFLSPKCRGWRGAVTDIGLVPRQSLFCSFPTHCTSIWISTESYDLAAWYITKHGHLYLSALKVESVSAARSEYDETTPLPIFFSSPWWLTMYILKIFDKIIEEDQDLSFSTFLWAVQSWRSLWHLFPCCRRPPRSYSRSSCSRPPWISSTLCWSCSFLSGQVVLLPPWRWLDLEWAE